MRPAPAARQRGQTAWRADCSRTQPSANRAMGYRTLRACIDDLAAVGPARAHRAAEVDPRLEAAAIHRRVYQAGGPALYFARVKGCRFPMASNLFGTLERARYIFRDTLDAVRKLVELKIDPRRAMQPSPGAT